MKRLFVAVDVPEDLRELAAARAAGLKSEFPGLRVGWERPEKMHLTLKFLGDTAPEMLADVRAAVRRAARDTGRFGLTLGGTGVFPGRKRARVLWLGVGDPDGALNALWQKLEARLAAVGVERERREFRPHLTIARLREPARSGELVGRHLGTDFEPVGFEVSRIVLCESVLKPTGSVYGAVDEFELY